MDLVTTIIRNSKKHLSPDGWLFIEIGGTEQTNAAYNIARNCGFNGSITAAKDLAGTDRVVAIEGKWKNL